MGRGGSGSVVGEGLWNGGGGGERDSKLKFPQSSRYGRD